jgi:hypothetical protein
MVMQHKEVINICRSCPEDRKPVVVKRIDPNSELGKKILLESIDNDKKSDGLEKKGDPNRFANSCYFRPKQGLTDSQRRAVLRHWRDDPDSFDS